MVDDGVAAGVEVGAPQEEAAQAGRVVDERRQLYVGGVVVQGGIEPVYMPLLPISKKGVILSEMLCTECVDSLVARFARTFLSKFPRPLGRTTAAVQPSKKKIARGTYTNTFNQTLRLSY